MAQSAVAEPRTALGSPAPPKLTYEEFLAWLDEETWAEWVDGEVVRMSPVNFEHQETARFLLNLLSFWVDFHNSGAIQYEPFLMKTGPNLPGRSPDILFVAEEHRDRLRQTYLDGPADLVVEVISPESRARDRGEKFYEYEQGGVREYWLIDPTRKQAECHQLGADGIYRTIPAGADGVYRSAVLPGLWIRVDWLWQDPLPSLLNILKEWRLV
ncbi:MAG: Uma2 family endonuclease [Armatimonadetes bacterium]|nr:Uma2 family endonuclease [Armatimonadota bacterium]